MSVIIWGKDNCPFCVQAVDLVERMEVKHEYRKIGDGWTVEQLHEIVPGARSVPQIIVNGNPVGGLSDFKKYIEDTGFNGTGHTLS